MPIAKREYGADSAGPLAGIRILDLSRLVAGNTLTLFSTRGVLQFTR